MNSTLSDLSLPLLPIPSSLQIEWDPTPYAISSVAQAHIDTRWSHYLAVAKAQNKSLFDGTITRLISHHLDTTNALHLKLGPASYKSFLVTRLRDRPWFEKYAPDVMTLALGNSALVTRGTEALLGIRSQNVGAYAGRLHLFGGALEQLNTPDFSASPAGIIKHLQLELSEELRITPADLAPAPRLLGIAHDTFLGQPELFWQWEATTDLADIARRADPAEHFGTLIVQKQTAPPESLAQMTPIAREVYRRWSNIL